LTSTSLARSALRAINRGVPADGEIFKNQAATDGSTVPTAAGL